MAAGEGFPSDNLTEEELNAVFSDPMWDEAWERSVAVLDVVGQIEAELAASGQLFDPGDPAHR